MRNIYVDFENCYGITKLKNTFEFNDEKKAHLVYAPNGMMKTSFANTIHDIYSNNETKDVFYPERITNRILKFDTIEGNDLQPNDILVINSYEESYKSENQNVLVADIDLKREYDQIHNEIDKKMELIFKQLNSLSGKRDSKDILSTDFDYSSKKVFDLIELIYDENNGNTYNDYSDIKYSSIFTPDSIKIFESDQVKQKLQEYIVQYEKLLTTSPVFKETFNHNNAENVLKILGSDGYFRADHKILLHNTEVAIGEEEFRTKIEDEKKRILDDELSTEFANIDKLLSSKKANHDLRDFLLANKHLILELVDIKNFKKKIWISYLFKNESVTYEAVLNYKNNKIRLKEIVNQAKEQLYKWNDVVRIFNDRFSNMPFSIDIENKDDVILNDQKPTFKFLYKDHGDQIQVNEEILKLRLSNGEKRALYLLNVIFELEAKRELGEQCFIIIDDIADSFDYRNKYAIIEYIKEIVETDLFLPVILTHNFDFYRTLAGRLGIKKSSYFVVRNNTELKFYMGQYFANVFDTWREQVYKNEWILISSVAFVRNLAEYIVGRNHPIYLNLTSLLHVKNSTSEGILKTRDIKISNLVDWYEEIWGRERVKFDFEGNCDVISMIYRLADELSRGTHSPINIEYKIVLSIAIRLKAEEYMINRINNNELVNNITSDQTRELKEMIMFEDNSSDSIRKQIIEKVLIITSENIHINSFMYEPIVDMSLEELVKLYIDVVNKLI